MWQNFQMKELRLAPKTRPPQHGEPYEVGQNDQWHEFERSAIAPCV
jgi:hypothetical protein